MFNPCEIDQIRPNILTHKLTTPTSTVWLKCDALQSQQANQSVRCKVTDIAKLIVAAAVPSQSFERQL